MEFVPYRTFPLAGRRGTTVLDRSTAYPLFGLRAGRRALDLVSRRRVSTSCTDSARACSATRAAAASSVGAAGAQSAGPRGVRRDGSVARAAQARGVPAAAACGARLRRRGGRGDRHRSSARAGRARAPGIPARADARHSQRARSPGDRRAGRAGRWSRDCAVARHVSAGERVLLSVGRLEAEQGLPRPAAARCRRPRDHGAPGRSARGDGSALGDGPYRPKLEALAAALSAWRIACDFSAASPIPRCTPGTRLATLFVHPTLYEGSSLVTLEAMAHRRAVVASSGGRAFPTRCGPDVNGWLVAAGRSRRRWPRRSAARSAIRRDSRDYGLAGRAIVEREFSWAAAGDATVALYRELLGR